MAQPAAISADSPATLGDLNTAVQALSDHFDGKLEALSDRFDGKLEALSDRFDGKLEALSDRFDEKLVALETRLSERIDGLEEKVDAHARETRLLLLVIVEKLFTPEEFQEALAHQAERESE